MQLSDYASCPCNSLHRVEYRGDDRMEGSDVGSLEDGENSPILEDAE